MTDSHPTHALNPSSPIASQANRRHWDNDAQDYHLRHPQYLESFYWSPEMLHENDIQLLGDVSSQTVLEIGCGSAPCGTWLADRFPTAIVIGFDISNNMLRHADNIAELPNIQLVQADATAMPFAANSFDTAFSVFGALPFIADLQQLFSDIAGILKPSGRFIYSINHPMRWVFPDDPEQSGLVAAIPYFEDAYIETKDHTVTYIEFQHTFGDHIRALYRAGFTLEDVIEPTWPSGLKETWGQWSPLRGEIFPGTAIFIAHLI